MTGVDSASAERAALIRCRLTSTACAVWHRAWNQIWLFSASCSTTGLDSDGQGSPKTCLAAHHALAEMRGYHIQITLNPRTPEDCVPASLFQQLPDHSISAKAPNFDSNSLRKDYRRGPITVNWMDFEEMQNAMAKEKGRSRGEFE